MNSQDYLINLKQDTEWQMHRLHFHEYVELMLFLSDGGEFFLDKDIYPLSRNSLMVLQPNTLHRDENDSKEGVFRRYVLHLRPSLLERLSTQQTNFAASIRDACPCTQLNEEDAARLVGLFEQLRTPREDCFGEDVRERILLDEILLLVCSCIQTSHIEAEISNADYNRVQPVLSYIQQNYRDPITLEDLANHFLISRHYLCHLFKKGTGFSVMEYVIQLRIIESQRLLRQGMNVQQVSESVGFQNYNHFIRTFSSYAGISPKQYAKRYIQGDHFEQ